MLESNDLTQASANNCRCLHQDQGCHHAGKQASNNPKPVLFVLVLQLDTVCVGLESTWKVAGPQMPVQLPTLTGAHNSDAFDWLVPLAWLPLPPDTVDIFFASSCLSRLKSLIVNVDFISVLLE
jgi:hypothetical protein